MLRLFLKGEALGSEWEERKAGREEATSQIIAVVVPCASLDLQFSRLAARSTVNT
jgi:hypothetical protein